MFRLTLVLVVSAATLFTASCASACQPLMCLVPGGPFLTENPFRLSVHVEPSRMTYGTNITVTYTLTNASTEAVGVCAAGWDSFELIDATGARLGGGTTLFTGYSDTTDPFRLPPSRTLSWQVRMVLDQVAPGPAQFRRLFQSETGN